jgi:hypothetical protein
VNGTRVRELRAIVAPSPVGPAAFVTEDGGTEEVSRVYFDGTAIDLGHGKGRAICGRKPVALDFDSTSGLTVHMTDGFHIHIPVALLRVSYRT